MISQLKWFLQFNKKIIYFLCFASFCFYILISLKKTAVQEKSKKYEVKFKDFTFNYRFETETPNCRNESVLIMITIKPTDFGFRNVMRKTMLKNMESSVTYRFFVAYSTNDSVMEKCFDEAKQYNDLVILGFYDDTFVSSVHKIYAVLNWQQTFCPSVKYVLKTQDNTLTSVSRLLQWIENKFDRIYNETDGKIFFCRTWTKDISDIATFTQRKPGELEYCERYAYLTTSKTVNLIMSYAVNEYLNTPLEELMFTGILAERVGAQRLHTPTHFGHTNKSDVCGCDNNGVPFIISNYVKFDNDLESLTKFTKFADKFMNLFCTNTSSRGEYFTACVAYTTP